MNGNIDQHAVGPSGPRLQHVRRIGTALGPCIGLVVLFLLFSACDMWQNRHDPENANFFTMYTVQQLLRDAAPVGIAALGMTVIIIAGGIDLSAGTAMALGATVTAWFIREDYHVVVALMAGIGTGCFCGFLNGTLISVLRVVPFIVTLGTMSIFLGTGWLLADNTPIRTDGKAPQWVLSLQQEIQPVHDWMLFGRGVWLMLGLAVIVAIILHLTVFGRHIFAIGSSESTARLCGVNVNFVRVAVYTLAGLFVGIAGILQFGTIGSGDPQQGIGKELRIIAAVVIGGGSLNGGRGSIVGTLAGACIMEVILTGCVSLGLSSTWRDVILGLLIVIAVTLDQIRQRRLMAGE